MAKKKKRLLTFLERIGDTGLGLESLDSIAEISQTGSIQSASSPRLLNQARSAVVGHRSGLSVNLQ